jgi:hypothetical protein
VDLLIGFKFFIEASINDKKAFLVGERLFDYVMVKPFPLSGNQDNDHDEQKLKAMDRRKFH